MLERVLKTILAVMFLAFFMLRIVHPVIIEAKIARTKLSQVRLSIHNMPASEQIRLKNVLHTEQLMISAQLKQIDKMLPGFASARIGAIANLEVLREKFDGKWQIQPSMQPDDVGNIVRWPVKLTFAGNFSTAVKVLASLENASPVNRLVSLEIAPGKTEEIELKANLEMLFSKDKGGMM